MRFRRSRTRPVLAALTLVLTVLTLSGCGSQAQTALRVQETLNDSLQRAQVDPDDKRARVLADQAIAEAPQDPSVYFGPTDPAASSPLPQLSIDLVFSAVGDDPALADYMAQAVQKFPNDYRGYQILSEAQGRLGRTAAQRTTALALIPVLLKALKTPGADSEALTLGLAQAYFDAGDAVNGAATCNKAIQAYPTDPVPRNNLAYAYAVANTNLPQALALSQQAMTLAKQKNLSDEETAIYQDTLGWVQYRQGDYADAEQNLLQAVSALPRLPDLRYHLGMVYVAQGNTDAARAELGHAVLLSQDFAAAQQALSTLPKQTAATLQGFQAHD